MTWVYPQSVWLLLLFLLNSREKDVAEAQRFNCTQGNCVDRPNFKIRSVVHGLTTDPFWQKIQASMFQAGKDMNVDFDMKLYDTFDDVVMAQDIATVDASTPDGLIVTIPDNTVQSTVGKVIENGKVPVFGLNTGAGVLTLPTKGFVEMDDITVGIKAGDTVRRVLLNNGTLVTENTTETNSTESDSENSTTRRKLASYAGIFVNHDSNSLAQQSRLLGLQYSAGDFLSVDDYSATPDTVAAALANCPYDVIVMSAAVALEPTLAAMKANECDNAKTLLAVLSLDDDPKAVYQAIENGEVAFAFSEQPYVEGAIPVVMATLFATTGKKLAAPSESASGAYLSGPKLITKENLPSAELQDCEAEGFPVCGGSLSPSSESSNTSCPCFNRSKLVIAGVTHGVDADGFWDEVFAASQQAANDFGVELKMPRIAQQKNDSFVHDIMSKQISIFCEEERVDGIFITIPSVALFDAIKKCQELNIPVLNINTGAVYVEELGLVSHIGQLEFRAGKSAGQKLIDAGATRGVCLYQEENNVALRERCDGLALAFNESGLTFSGAVFVFPGAYISVFIEAVEGTLNEDGDWEGVGLLVGGTSILEEALEIKKAHPGLLVGTFDLNDFVFSALQDRNVLFAIDQNAYLQGYLPIPFLVWHAQTQQILLDKFVESGPDFVEAAPTDAAAQCQALFYETCEGATMAPIQCAAPAGKDYCTSAPDLNCYPSTCGWPACCFLPVGNCTAQKPACEKIGAEYCTWAPNKTCYPSTNGRPSCCQGNGVESCPTSPPACETVGVSYCTFAPNFGCYPFSFGWPACCTNSSLVCPATAPACENIGSGYCTNAPNLDCYPSTYGRPACCTNQSQVCPVDQPKCEEPGSNYCAYAPNTHCYPTTFGWPSCCTTPGATCLSTQPACETNDQIVGTYYCTESPNMDCYPYSYGWPTCCLKWNVVCPTEKPACQASGPNSAEGGNSSTMDGGKSSTTNSGGTAAFMVMMMGGDHLAFLGAASDFVTVVLPVITCLTVITNYG